MRIRVLILLSLASGCHSAERNYITDKSNCLIVPQLVQGYSEWHREIDRTLITFQRLCRGDTHFTMNVSLIPRETWPDGPGNILVIERPVPKDEDDYPMAFAFLDSGGIDVSYDENSRVLSKDTLIDGLRVRFSFNDTTTPKPPTASRASGGIRNRSASTR